MLDENCMEELDYANETVGSLVNLAQYFPNAKKELDKRLDEFAKTIEPQTNAIKSDGTGRR